MPDLRYTVLLNEALKKSILGLPDPERRRLREKFEFLENGFWDAGVRVKKLKGSPGKVIFEARLTRGDRILFTLGSHENRTAIFVWAITRHDDIQEAAERIAPANAPFLGFEPIETEERPDLAIDSLPPSMLTQEDLDQSVPEDSGPQKWLVLDEEEWRRILQSPDPERFELFLYLTREQESILQADPPVLLSGTAGSGKTTICVYLLLRPGFRDRPRLLLTFNPALKKLSERIYDGLVEKRAASGRRPRFMTFRELLEEMTAGSASHFPAEKEIGLPEFARIFHNHKASRSHDPELVWEEIRSIIKGAKVPLNPKRYERLAAGYLSQSLSPRERAELREYLAGLKSLEISRKVERFLAKRTGLKDYDALLAAVAASELAVRPALGPVEQQDVRAALEEIARIVREKASDFSRPLLSLDEYLFLGAKRAPNFLYDRAEIYGIAEYYQSRLGETGSWDEIDLCRAAVQRAGERALGEGARALGEGARALGGGAAPSEHVYDLVVCDEAQDFADIQLSLVFRLASDPRRVVFAGDPRQIINPSGFRWEEVKNKFFERGLPVPEVKRLSLNFRCVGAIVKLANALLDLKQSLIGLSDTEARERWKFDGKPPLLVDGISESRMLQRIDFRGAGQVVLTRTSAEQARLKKALGSELVFTIQEAKGLEFDTVLLWKFLEAEGAEETWRRILGGLSIERAHIPHLRHEISLLYVAITRARNSLIVYDGPSASLVWAIESLSVLMFRTAEEERLSELWKAASSPSEWDAQGEYFLERGHHAAARECFKNAGNLERLALAEAHLAEKDGRFADAAPVFETNGLDRKAAGCYEKAGGAAGWRKAAELWERLGEGERAEICRIRLLEARGDFRAAAREWERRGEMDKAFAGWEKAGEFGRLAKLYFEKKNYQKARDLFEKARMPKEAARCLEKLGQLPKAAEAYFSAGDFKNAARLYRRTGNQDRVLLCYRQLKDFHALGEIYQRAGEIDKAIAAFKQFASASGQNAARLLKEGSRPVKGALGARKAAVRLSALSLFERSAPLHLASGSSSIAAREYGLVADHAGLARALARMGKFEEAAGEVEKSELSEIEKEGFAVECFSSLLDAAGSRLRPVEARLRDETEALLRSGKHGPALARAKALEDAGLVLQAFKGLARDEEAIEWLIRHGSPENALAYVRSRQIAVSMPFFKRLRPSHLVRGRYTGEDYRAIIEILIELLGSSSRTVDPQVATAMVREYMDDILGELPFEEYTSDKALDMMIRHRCYRSIMRLFVAETWFMKKHPARVVRFADDVKEAALREDDPRLAACAAFVLDKTALERIVGALELDGESVEIMGCSETRWVEAVEYLAGAGRFEDAEGYCRMHEDLARAGAMLERSGDLIQAFRSYMDAKAYDAAMRVADAMGDRRRVARVLEHTGELQQAIDLWEKLGRTRDAARVTAKLRKMRRPG